MLGRGAGVRVVVARVLLTEAVGLLVGGGTSTAPWLVFTRRQLVAPASAPAVVGRVWVGGRDSVA